MNLCLSASLFAALAWLLRIGILHPRRAVPADPMEVPTFESLEGSDRFRAEHTISAITGKRKNYLTWLQGLHGSSPSTANIVVIGDSYADDIDMDFICWPAQLALASDLSMVNMAHGGSVSKDTRNQLERAIDFMQANGLKIDAGKHVLVVHSGGNDILHALRNPFQLFTLVVHLWQCRLAQGGWILQPQQFEFAERIADQVSQEIDALVSDAARYGFTNVLVSELPISPALPLARLLVHLITLGNADLVTDVLQSLAQVMRQRLSIALHESSINHSIRLKVFKEGMHLEEIARNASADRLGIWQVATLLGKQIARTFRWKDEPQKRFWLDGHHPSIVAHTSLARRAASIIEPFGIVIDEKTF